MKKLIYFFLSFCLWLLSISSLAQYVKITKDSDCGLYKGEILMASDSLYSKEGKLATPKYGKIRVLGFTEAYKENYQERGKSNKASNFQKDSLYDISQDAADLTSVHFKGADGVDRYSVSGLEIEKVQTGYLEDSRRLYYKAYLSDKMCWFVSTQDAEKYTRQTIVHKAEAVLDKSYREGNDVYILCEDTVRVVIEGITKPVTIKAGEKTKQADVSGRKMRFIFDGGLSFVIPFEDFKRKDELTMQEKVVYGLIAVVLLLILYLMLRYKKQLYNWLKEIMNKGNSSVGGEAPFPKGNSESKDGSPLDQARNPVEGEAPFPKGNSGSEDGSPLDQATNPVGGEAPFPEGNSGSEDGSPLGQATNNPVGGGASIPENNSGLGNGSLFDQSTIDQIIHAMRDLIDEKFLSGNLPVNESGKKVDFEAIQNDLFNINSFIDNSVKPDIALFVKKTDLDDLKTNFNIKDLEEFIEKKIREGNNTATTEIIEGINKYRSDEEERKLDQKRSELIEEQVRLQKEKNELEQQESNPIKTGVKVENCNSFVGFADNFLSICQDAEKDIYFRMKKMSVDEKVKAEPILSEYYQTRPTSMIEKWNRILATLKMCGYVSDAFIEDKNIKERGQYIQEYFFKEVVRPYTSALLIYLERFRTSEYIDLELDGSFVGTLSNNIEAIIQVCRINEIEVIYQKFFEQLNLSGEQYKNYEITKQKPNDKLSNLLIAKDSLKKNLLLSVSEYAVNSITTERGYSTPQKTKCRVLDI